VTEKYIKGDEGQSNITVVMLNI